MKTFDIPAKTRLLLTKTTPRKEHHGEDLVQAVSLRLRWETTNENLVLVHPQLKDMLFWKTPAVEAQAELAGLPDITPNLRVPTLALPVKIDLAFSGYTMHIEHGIDEDSALELYVCGLEKFAVDAKEGGTAVIEFSLASNKEVTPELVGVLCGLEGGEIIATLTPPAIAAGPVIDGSTEAFERDHPDETSLLDGDAEPMDATGAFVDQHAGNFGADLDDVSDAEGLEMHAEPEVPKDRGRRGRKTAEVE